MEESTNTSWIFWFVLGLLILYIFLRIMGVIKTPEWIEVSPLALIVILFLQTRTEMKSYIRSTIKPVKDSMDDLKQVLSRQEGRIEMIPHLTKRREE